MDIRCWQTICLRRRCTRALNSLNVWRYFYMEFIQCDDNNRVRNIKCEARRGKILSKNTFLLRRVARLRERDMTHTHTHNSTTLVLVLSILFIMFSLDLIAESHLIIINLSQNVTIPMSCRNILHTECDTFRQTNDMCTSLSIRCLLLDLLHFFFSVFKFFIHPNIGREVDIIVRNEQAKDRVAISLSHRQ